MAKMTFLAAEGCLFSGISGLTDSFSIANLWNRALNNQGPDPLFETEIVTVEGDPVIANGGIRVCPDRPIKDVSRTDLILIPPFLPVGEPLTQKMGDICDWLIDRYQGKTNIAAMCTGAFMLAETGLLTGKITAIRKYWRFRNGWRDTTPTASPSRPSPGKQVSVRGISSGGSKRRPGNPPSAIFRICVWKRRKNGWRRPAIT